jgi:nitrogen fixation/metabolism regulation signal transduction histidine kinase
VLANMSAGVMVLDHEFHLISCNDSVERILQQAGVTMIGQKLDEIEGLQEFGGAIVAAFAAQSAVGGRPQPRAPALAAPDRVPRQAAGVEGNDLTLLTRGSRLPVEAAAATWWCSTISPT